MRLFFVLGGVGSAIVAVHCSAAPTQHSFPQQHRPTVAACSTTRPPGITTDGGLVGTCATDADCTQGTNGRCGPSQAKGYSCSYDLCFTDTDCAAGTSCNCSPQGNACLPSTCRSDADCAGLGCSPTYDTSCGAYHGTQGIYCHTKDDTCTDDTDCTEGGAGYCAYQLDVGHWACSYGFCAG